MLYIRIITQLHLELLFAGTAYYYSITPIVYFIENCLELYKLFSLIFFHLDFRALFGWDD